jgi:hypothetical protein
MAKLRDYQRKAINDFECLVASGARSVLEQSPDEPSIATAGAALQILALRSLKLADQVASGELPFLDTVNTIYDAAVEAGLIATVGDRIVQATIAAAFANARRPA